MAKSSNKWLERYTDGGLYIPLEGTSYVVRQQISKPRTYGDGGKYLTVNGEYHRVYENAEGDIMVNHPKEDKGKWDTINLTQKAKAKTIAQGIAATKKWHRENPEYANGGLNNQDPPVESLRSVTTYPITPQNFVPIKWDAKTQKQNELLQKSINERTKNTPEFKKARKLTKEEQDYSDKVKARIENPSADVGILAANMASALTRLQYLTPDEIKKITNNPKATTELAADILGQGLTNELIGGAVTVAPQAIKSVGKYLTEGPLKNTSKLNPWAYQYNLPKNVMWRGLGQEGMEDAINSGVFRSKQNVIPEYYPGTKLQANKSFGTNPYFTPNFNTAANYGDNFIAEVPKDVVNWKNRYGKGKTWSQIANKPIPIEQGRILQKHWLKGYKEVPKPTSSKSVENIFSSKKEPLKDWMIEEMRFANLPELNNPNASEVLENFKKRISTPEGQKRLKKLGITETDVFDKLKIVADKNTLGQYWLNKIGLHPELPEVRRVTRHEIEHGVQDAYLKSKLKQANKFKFSDLFGSNEKSKRIYKALNDETTSIDKSLQNLELRKTPQDVDWKLLKETRGKQNPSNLFNYMSDKQRATNYFASGSKGREKSAFLSEVQQYMMDQGIIPKTSYIEITPEMVKNTFIDAMFDEKGGGKYLRLFNIMKPTEANYKLISKNLNKMLGLVPAGIVGAAALQQKENGGWLNKYEQGGYADDSAVLNTEGQEVNTMQFALPTVPTFNFGNGDGDGEDPKNKKKSKDKKTDTRTIGQKRHDALEAAKTKILKTESPENKKKMDMLYSTTMAAENTYGYDPKAYGRKKQTRSPMSIDNIALDELFNPKGEKNRYTLQQKSNFDLLRSLGLPTDKAKLKELLETDDAYAGLGVAKTLYYNEGALKNLPNPTDTAAYINLYLNEYNKSGALKYQKRNELIDNITNKMRAQGKRETKTIKPVVKNKTTK